MNLSGKWALRAMPRRITWLVFAAGIIAGFALTVLVNFFAKLAVTAIVLFGVGFLAGRYWRRRCSQPTESLMP